MSIQREYRQCSSRVVPLKVGVLSLPPPLMGQIRLQKENKKAIIFLRLKDLETEFSKFRLRNILAIIGESFKTNDAFSMHFRVRSCLSQSALLLEGICGVKFSSFIHQTLDSTDSPAIC